MSNIKIIVCAHKDVPLPQHPYFLPVQAGAALHPHIKGFQPDDEGDNISEKNPHFCELTCHYWAWKNLKQVDIVGLNHYRRFFDFWCKWPSVSPYKRFSHTENFLKYPYYFPDLEQTMKDCDIILPTRRHWRTSNTRQYGEYHIAKDWETLRQIIAERSPEYLPSFEQTMDHSNKASGYNMFITHWKYFDLYSAWLFDILFEVERRVPPAEDPIQSRIYGYMSERLINVFCHHHRLRIKYVPLIMPIDEHVEEWVLNPSNLHWCYQRTKNDLIYLLKSRL
ncbi:MAG: DUF4422 domain-containing protein [Prevotella sp.]|nr:DUF4422 domain-containing protein [Prevotella sp.]MBR6867065.1 DUF4422 domain-containing protein [Prevotella sp.]